MKQPTERVREAVNELLTCNERTRGAVVGGRNMYLGDDVLVVPLVRPVVIEGQWTNVEESRTADLFDLMDMHTREAAGQEEIKETDDETNTSH